MTCDFHNSNTLSKFYIFWTASVHQTYPRTLNTLHLAIQLANIICHTSKKMAPTQHLTLDPSHPLPPTRNHPESAISTSMPDAKETKVHPTISGAENASLYFVGTATTILSWAGVRLMTDPNFLYETPFSQNTKCREILSIELQC